MLRCPHKARFHSRNLGGSFTGPLMHVFIAGRAIERNFEMSRLQGRPQKTSWVEFQVDRNNQTIQLKKSLLPVDTEDTCEDLHGVRKSVELPYLFSRLTCAGSLQLSEPRIRWFLISSFEFYGDKSALLSRKRGLTRCIHNAQQQHTFMPLFLLA